MAKLAAEACNEDLAGTVDYSVRPSSFLHLASQSCYSSSVAHSLTHLMGIDQASDTEVQEVDDWDAAETAAAQEARGDSDDLVVQSVDVEGVDGMACSARADVAVVVDAVGYLVEADWLLPSSRDLVHHLGPLALVKATRTGRYLTS